MEILLFPRSGQILRSGHPPVPHCPDLGGLTVLSMLPHIRTNADKGELYLRRNVRATKCPPFDNDTIKSGPQNGMKHVPSLKGY